MECTHRGCTCTVSEDAYCGEYCAEHAGDVETDQNCQCGHPACEGSIETI